MDKDEIVKRATDQYETDMKKDFFKLTECQGKLPIERLNQMMEYYKSKEEYMRCSKIKLAIDELMDN